MANPLLHVTDYRKTWLDGYKRQTEQMDRSIKQLQERDRQQYQASTAVTPVKMLNQLADTINKVGTAAKGFDDLKKKKVFQDLDALGVSSKGFDYLEQLAKHDGDVNKLEQEYNNYSELISGLDVETIDYLKSLHGRNLYWGKAYLTKQKAIELPGRYEALLNYEGDDPTMLADKFKLVTDLAETDNLGKNAVRRRWAAKQFGDEFISNEILSEYAGESIYKFSTSTDILTVHETAKLTLGKELQTWKQNLKIANTSPAHLRQFIARDIENTEASIANATKEWTSTGVKVNGIHVDGIFQTHDPKTVNRAIARKMVITKLEDLAHANQFLRADLDHLREKNTIKGAPQGTSIETFFTQDELDPLFTAADRATFRASQRSQQLKEKANEQRLADTEVNYSGEKWNRGAWKQTFNFLQLNGGTKKQLDRAEFMMNNTNSTDSYTRAETDFGLFKDGAYLTVDDDVIAAIPNVNYRTEAETIKAHYSDTYVAAGTEELINSSIQGKLQGVGITFDPREKLKGEASWVQKDLQRKAAELAVQGINLKYSGDDLNNFVTSKLDEYWVANGGGRKTTDFKGKELQGKFTVDQNNNFTRHKTERQKVWEEAYQLDIEQRQATVGLTQKDLDNVRFSLKDKFFDAGGYLNPNARDVIMSTPNSCVTLRDFEVMIANGGYSQKLLAQAEVLKVAPGTLFEMQLNALQNQKTDDPEAQQLLQNILGDNQIQIPDTEVAFNEAIKDNPVLTALFRNGTYKYANLKKRKRIAFAFINDDWDQAELIWPGGVPYRIGFDRQARFKLQGRLESEQNEWGPDGQPSVTLQKVMTNEALKALEDK